MTDVDVTQDVVTVEVVEDTVTIEDSSQVVTVQVTDPAPSVIVEVVEEKVQVTVTDPGGVTVEVAAIAFHKLADTTGLGVHHSVSDLTAGMVLRATGPTAAAFSAIEAGDIAPAIAAMGTNNRLPKFSTASGLENSSITDDGSTVTVAAPNMVVGALSVGSINQGAVTAHEGAINHDALLNFVAGEHFLQSAITVVGTIATGVWNATAVAWAKVNKAGSVLDDIADVTIVGNTAGELLK
ncbi:hypothetical protein LCGC14_2390650, partial [marine sediment metagenome]